MAIKGLYAGSFDPITNGHLDLIKRASKICDQLVIGVVVNPQKQSLISLDRRVELIKEVTCDIPNVKVEYFSGLLADYVNNNGFDVVFRGLRNAMDFDAEIAMAQVNDRLYNKHVETLFLMTSPEYSFISSSMIKEIASLHGEIKGLVPENVYNELKTIYK
ncbi:MAG: pantetheine-phosphate adenylyltransferase [Clostridia bacterium]|nr:pantetheine-phosphate adenylyltransferase [Clostridia bacterium]